MPDTRDELIAEYVRATFAHNEAMRAFARIPMNVYASPTRLIEAGEHLQDIYNELRHRYPDEDW